uniref:Uncharacterized protein n=1 Tax=Plectus sambesii TaxID=2011161 RepID=A0A914XM19_9BILA
MGVPESEKPKDVGEIVTNEIDIHEMDIDLLLPTTSMAQKEQAQKEQRAPPETPTSLMLQQLTKYAINRPAIVPQMPKRSRGGRSKQNAPPAQSMASADQLKRAAVEHAQLLLRQKQKHAAEISARNSNSQGATSSLMSPSRRPQTSRQAHLEMEKKKKKRVEESPLSNSPSRALTQWMLKEKAVNKSPQAGGPKLDAVYVRKELSASMRRATNEVLKQSVPVVDVTNRLAGWTPVGAALAGSGGLTPSAITPSASPPPSGSIANVNRAFQDPELNALVQRKMAQVKQAFAPPPAPYGVHHVQSAPVMSDSGLYQLGSVPSYQQPTTHAGPWLTETIQTPTTHAGDWAMASFGHDVVDDWATPTALTTFPPMATSSQQISAVGGGPLEAPSTAPVAVDDVDKELDQSWEMDRGMTISDYFGL